MSGKWIKPHWCQFPRDIDGHVHGDIWQCDECEKHYELLRDDLHGTWGWGLRNLYAH